MATLSDILTTSLSPLATTNALLDKGPDWNFDTTSAASNTITYTFSVASGLEVDDNGRLVYTGQQQFSTSQQQYAVQAFNYLHQLTGINFVQTSDGASADLHLCNIDIPASNTTGLCSWQASYSYDGSALVSYDAHAYVYLDNREWRGQNSNLAPGGDGYETLLHELGHALGLKHPFDVETENANTLPLSQDSTYYTLMSYNSAGGPYTTYRQYDLSALAWLYGGDGLGGKLGLGDGTTGKYIIGTDGADTFSATSGNDVVEGDGGNDTLDGAGGLDTAVFRGAYASYVVTTSNGVVTVKGGTDGTDTLSNIETLQFSDRTIAVSQLAAGQAVNGTDGPDSFIAQAGNNSYNGGAGLDKITYGAARATFTVAHTADGGFTITDSAGNGGIDTLVNVERAYFSDHSAVAMDIAGTAGLAYRMYKAAFDRAPDAEGLGYWISVFDRGASPDAVAQGFIDGNEFTSKWGANISTVDFLTALYTNLRHAPPDAAGLAFWQHVIDDVHMSRGYVMAQFATSGEMQAAVIGQVQDGIVYTPYG